MNKSCPFCDHEIRKRALGKNKSAYVILSNPRVVRGHLLVIPKRHVNKLSELKIDEAKEIFKLLSFYQEKILRFSEGSEIRQNHKPYIENNDTHVNHLHFHLIPRAEKDELAKKVDKLRKPLYKELSNKERRELEKLLL